MAGDETLKFTLVRSAARKRTLALSVGAGGELRVLAPARAPLDEIRDFVARRVDWVAKRRDAIAAAPPPKGLLSGDRLPYLDGDLKLEVRRIAFSPPEVTRKGDVLDVLVPSELADGAVHATVRGLLLEWYRREAETVLRERVLRWAPAVGQEPKSVQARDQKAQWGSCSPDGRLRFNLRLAMMPLRLIDYVVVHELAHLVHANHGDLYWAVVGGVLPDHHQRRAELQRAGAHLPL